MKFTHFNPRICKISRNPSYATIRTSRSFTYKSRTKEEAFEDLEVVVTKVKKKKSDKLGLPPSSNDIRLIIEPNYTHMENANLPDDTYKQLLKELYNRFKKRTGNEFVVKHLSGGDYPIGWTSFFSDKTGRFPSGLVTDITSLLFESNISFDKIDRRPELDPEVLKDAVVTPDLFKDAPTPVKLRDYQVEIANIALRSQRGIIKCATGGGKTLIFASILKALKNRFPAVILFRNKTLVTQTHEVFQKCGLPNVGKITGDEQEPDLITCCTVQSVHKLPHPKDIKLLIADECHGFATPDSIKAIRSFENTLWRLGFSATPFKNDDVQNFKLKSWFGPQLCDITTSDLTTKSILAESTIHFYPINQPTWLESLGWPDAEEEGVVHNEYLHKSVATLVNKIDKGRILILVKRLNQGDQLVKLIPGAFWVKGEDTAETREYVLNQLRYNTQEKVVAIFSPIGYIGLDVFVHHIVNCTGGKEASLTIQQLGRGLRKAPDKESCEYHDFYHTTNKYLKDHSQARVQTLKKEGHNLIMEPAIL